ncbi:melatonin receptor type 1B-B-like [Saccostrea cucullata]|uniref:melatonin receptor type 1B-B-like n=1 Tax=Saccostrea cuccullata TaxID=36930 RepID=UPI002ED01D2E
MGDLKCSNGTFYINDTVDNYENYDNDTIKKGIFPLLQTDTLLAVLYIIITSTALLVGTVGNTLTILVSTVRRDVNKCGKEFVVNLALADLCVTAIADPMCIIGVTHGDQFFQGRKQFCIFVASLCLTACFCAFFSLFLMSMSRFIYLRHNHVYDKLFNRVTSILLCFACWMVAFSFEIPNFVGWGGHFFDHKNHQCIWDRTASLSYTMFVSMILIGAPLVVMAICHFLIFKRIWETKRNIYSLDIANPLRMRKVWRETVRSSQMLFCIFIAFVICWTPYAIIVTLDVQDTFPMKVHLFITLTAHLHSSVNGIIYFAGNKRFRIGILRLCVRRSTRKGTPTSGPYVIPHLDSRL